MRTWKVLAPLLVLVGLTGCILLFGDDRFERSASLFGGEIHGTALFDVDGSAEIAPYAQVKVRGTNQVRRADENGEFVVWDLEAGPWVLQVTQDEDGDGLPDRRRIVSTILREAPHVTSTFGAPEQRLTGVSVGEVVLEGTAEVGGEVLLTPPGGGTPVPPSALGRNVIVLAGRNFDLPKLTGDGFDPVSLGAQARTHVDDDGAFLLRNLGGGAIFLLVLVYDEVVDTSDSASLRRVSPQVFVRALPDGSTSLAAPIVLPAEDAPTQTTSMSLLMSPPLTAGEQAYLIFYSPGQAVENTCTFPPGNPPSAFVSAVVDGGAVVTFNQVPVGTWDIQVCTSRQDDGAPVLGFLEGETLYELEDGVVAPLTGPVLIGNKVDACFQKRRCRSTDDCPGDLVCPEETPGEERFCEALDGELFYDCDGDGRRGLPPPEFPGAPLPPEWAACASCGQNAGTDGVDDATCDVAGVLFDCDDDGDGQADVTEPACYGPNKGADSDSDGICDGVDAFPECRANTAAGCEAGVNDQPIPTGGDQPGQGCTVEAAGVDVISRSEGTSNYCAVNGTSGSCEGYEMQCTTLESELLVARSCEDDISLCAEFDPLQSEQPESFSLCDDEELGSGTFECHYLDPNLSSSCGDLACPVGFECDDTKEIAFCKPLEGATVDLECLCSSPDAEPGIEQVMGHRLQEPLTCGVSPTDAAVLWAACGFPAITGVGAPTTGFDAGPNVSVDGGGDVGEDLNPCSLGQPVCDPNALQPTLLTCPTGDAVDSNQCGFECGAPTCVGGEACTNGDVCLARTDGPCNVAGFFLLDPTTTPTFCESGQACSLRLEALDGPPQATQICNSTETMCANTGFPVATCSDAQPNVLEVCAPFNGDTAESPVQFNCQVSGGNCLEPAAGEGVCVGTAEGAFCDPDFMAGLDGINGVPFTCGGALICQRDLPGDRFGTCQPGAGMPMQDAGPTDAGGAG